MAGRRAAHSARRPPACASPAGQPPASPVAGPRSSPTSRPSHKALPIPAPAFIDEGEPDLTRLAGANEHHQVVQVIGTAPQGIRRALQRPLQMGPCVINNDVHKARQAWQGASLAGASLAGASLFAHGSWCCSPASVDGPRVRWICSS